MMMSNNTTMNNQTDDYRNRDIDEHDDYYIRYAYNLPSDNSRFVSWNSHHDFTRDITATGGSLMRVWAYISIAFGVLVLIHSFIINRRRMHFVRIASDVSAASCAVYGIMYLTSSYRPNRTKTCIAWDLCAYGLCSLGIQLSDAYIFLNRYRAVTKVSDWKLWATHFYIILVTIIPYYSAVFLLPFFIDMNSALGLLIYNRTLIVDIWGTVLFNVFYTFEFLHLAYKLNKKQKNFSKETTNIKWIIYKSLIHCSTSSIANIRKKRKVEFNHTSPTFHVIYSTFLFNIILVCGIHFLFNYKIENSCLVKRRSKRNIRKSSISKSFALNFLKNLGSSRKLTFRIYHS
jgi:hypothetical protein